MNLLANLLLFCHHPLSVQLSLKLMMKILKISPSSKCLAKNHFFHILLNLPLVLAHVWGQNTIAAPPHLETSNIVVLWIDSWFPNFQESAQSILWFFLGFALEPASPPFALSGYPSFVAFLRFSIKLCA